MTTILSVPIEFLDVVVPQVAQPELYGAGCTETPAAVVALIASAARHSLHAPIPLVERVAGIIMARRRARSE